MHLECQTLLLSQSDQLTDQEGTPVPFAGSPDQMSLLSDCPTAACLCLCLNPNQQQEMMSTSLRWEQRMPS